MNPILTELKWRLVGQFGSQLVNLIFRTARLDVSGYQNVKSRLNAKNNFIAAIWHSRILYFSYAFKNWRAAIMVSSSKDGEIIARLLKQKGHEPVRGSSSKGGLRALAALIRKMKGGQAAVIIPDGPQGPRYQVQPGIILLAQKTGAPILPMTYSAEHAKVFSSWDRFMLPRPFTRCRVIYGEPVYVPKDINEKSAALYMQQLENELNRITQEADRAAGRETP